MGTNRPRALIGRHAGVGLSAGSGGTLDVDLAELTAADVDVANDEIPIIDHDGSHGSKKESIADLATGMAGEGIIATAGVLSLDMDEFGDAEIDVAVDTLPFIDESAAGDPGKLESVADFVGKIAGTTATSALGATNGVLQVEPANCTAGVVGPTDTFMFGDTDDNNLPKTETISDLFTLLNGITYAKADDEGSIFYHALEVDFGGALAVDQKITDAAKAKGKLIGVQAVVSEGFSGDADSVISISTAAAGAAKMCSDITVDKDAGQGGNYVGASFGVVPNSDNSEIVASGGDVYAYSGACNNRAAGKIRFLLWFMKTA